MTLEFFSSNIAIFFLQNHPWFEGIDWDTIRLGQAPYIPDVSSPTDTSNFDVDDNDFRIPDAFPPIANPAFTGHHLPFIGFTFTQGSCMSDCGKLFREPLTSESSPSLISNGAHVKSLGGDEKRLSPDSTRKLQDEINILTKRNCELENHIKSMEKGGGGGGGGFDTLDGQIEAKLREMEKTIRTLKNEKEDLAKEKQDALERLKIQEKELKDAIAQRKLAMDEYTEVTDKLSDLRTQKQKLSRQVRDKEEELDTAMQKIDTLRNDIRKAEKNRREMDSRLQDAVTEATKV